MQADSTDLRRRVITACDAHDGTRPQITDRFCVSIHWVRKLLRQRRETGCIAPRPAAAGIPEPSVTRLVNASARPPWPTKDVILAEVTRAAGVVCSDSVVNRRLTSLGVTRITSPGGRAGKPVAAPPPHGH